MVEVDRRKTGVEEDLLNEGGGYEGGAIRRSWPCELSYLDTSIITPEIAEATTLWYHRAWEAYKNVYEWNPEMIRRTDNDYFSFFVSQIPRNGVKPKVLDVGCGTGRDSNRLLLRNIDVVSVDVAENMARAANIMAEGATVYNDDIRNMRFVSDSFHGILMESALQHIPKTDVPDLFRLFADWSRDNAILLVRFRITNSGNVFVVSDGFGARYFTSYTRGEVDRIIQDVAGKFNFVGSKENQHVDSHRPPFFSVAFKRRADNQHGYNMTGGQD